MRLQVDHATSADSGWRRLLEVRRLKDEVHVVGHLNDFSAHQTQLQRQQQLQQLRCLRHNYS